MTDGTSALRLDEARQHPTPPLQAPLNAGTPVAEPLDPQRAVMLAKRLICRADSATHVGLTLVPEGRAPETIAATDDVPIRVDWLQHELGQGPSVRSRFTGVVVSPDLAIDRRWPDFGRLCVAVLDVRSMVSVAVPLGTTDRAMVNFYSSDPAAFDLFDVDAARKLARQVAPIVGTALDDLRGPLVAAQQADCSRIAVALALVMATYRLTSCQAFELLSEAGRQHDRTLLAVAIDVVATGSLPPDVPPRRRHGGAALWTARSDVQTPCIQVGGPDMWHER
jgi:hypothetical protein